MLVISRRMPLEPPVPSVASSFRSRRIIADARLQRVSPRLNGTARIARACSREGGARLTSSLPNRETHRTWLSISIVVGGTTLQCLYFVISNHGHDNGLSSLSADTTGTGFNEAWVGEP